MLLWGRCEKQQPWYISRNTRDIYLETCRATENSSQDSRFIDSNSELVHPGAVPLVIICSVWYLIYERKLNRLSDVIKQYDVGSERQSVERLRYLLFSVPRSYIVRLCCAWENVFLMWENYLDPNICCKFI
jgi:hypothetical protein